MTTTTTFSRREDGFTLLELLLVIGVAALLLIGGIATYRLVSDGNKTTEATRLLLTLRQEAQVMSQQQGGNYDGITFDSATSAPNSPLVISGVLRDGQRNPFNGDIVIAPTGVNNVQLEVQFTNISQASCLKMIQAINNPNEVVEIATDDGQYVAANGDLPLSATDAATACGQSLNNITWVFP